MVCWCGYQPRGKPEYFVKSMARHVERHVGKGRLSPADFPEQFTRLANHRLARERAMSLCKMYLIGKRTGQWAESRYGHLADGQVIALILELLEAGDDMISYPSPSST